MKKMLNRLGVAVSGAVSALAGGASVALANPIIDVAGMTPDISMVGTLGAAITTGLLGIWGVRKVIKLVNRS